MENKRVKKKLIEVALPLEAINKASAREKSIRHGHPSTLHLWWARRPLAAARAVIFSQMVDDPSSYPDLFPTEKAQEKERQRLFKIIEELVLWENTTNEEVLQRAREEIWQSWRRECKAQQEANSEAGNMKQEAKSEAGSVKQEANGKDTPSAPCSSLLATLFDPNKLPAFHDPFAGGGALPLEAQRLGLEAYASDLNPVAVLINKAMIEIPPKFAGKPPVNPEARKDKTLIAREWKGAQGLAEDVRYYGKWMRDEAEKRIGHLYPKVEITADMAKERPDLKPLIGKKLTVIAWLWARTVKSPNPAFASVDVPLASTFMLSTKTGKEAYVEPLIEGNSYSFKVKMGKPKDAEAAKRGTKSGSSGSSFLCLMSGTPMPFEYLRLEAKAGRMGGRLTAIVAEGERGRVYLSPTNQIEAIALSAKPEDVPETDLPKKALGFRIQEYGMTRWSDLFTPRQLVALTTFSDLVTEAREKVKEDAEKAEAGSKKQEAGSKKQEAGSMNSRSSLHASRSLNDGGTGVTAYAEAVGVYLAFALSKVANIGSSIASWMSDRGAFRETFARQAIPMVWDYAESNPFTDAGGSLGTALDKGAMVLDAFPATQLSCAVQADAATQAISADKVVSTDPPYYDNIGYADLSDFFYVWLRRSLKSVFSDLFSTLAVPKAEELVATPYRHGSKEKAETFFLHGMTRAMHRLAEQAHSAFPVTIYYAFKQSESDGDDGMTNTGWETFLDAVIRAGFALSGTWPMRTEGAGRIIAKDTNALASSIVLVCRPRPTDAPTTTRREFMNQLKAELPVALAHLQKGNIAPVDLAQSAIGPGMAVYTRYSKVLDAAGNPLSVREALALINQTLDEVLAEQEGDFDADTRWALAWFEQCGFSDGEFGVANVLATAKNTSVAGLAQDGFVISKAGKVRLVRPNELSSDWDPTTDTRLTVWEMVHHLIRVLEAGGEGAAAALVAKLGSKAEIARELAYRLYTICERKKRAQEALAYNALVQSWPEIVQLAAGSGKQEAVQERLI